MIATHHVEGFDWDIHNADKIWKKHEVPTGEAEEAFFDGGLKVLPDVRHSRGEGRYYALGKSRLGRMLFVCFTLRKDKIRVISARDMSHKERRHYHEKVQKDTNVSE